MNRIRGGASGRLPVLLAVTLAVAVLAGAVPASDDGRALASHGGGTSGGCSGDCTPPTMGIDNGGKQVVSGGFAINGASFDVTYYKQDIPTQEVGAGEPVRITVTAFENTGPQYLSHVRLAMGIQDKFVAGVTVETPAAQIDWDKGFDGRTSVEIGDPDGLITDVSVREEIAPPNNVLHFEFTPTRAFDVGRMAVQTWDANRNPWTNYFYDAMRIVPAQEQAGDGGAAAGADAAAGAIPAWVRDSAGWWADGMIDDGTFMEAIQYLIGAGVMQVPPAGQSGPPAGPADGGGTIPAWVRNSAGWWADGMIDDGTFVEAIQYLAAKGVIRT